MERIEDRVRRLPLWQGEVTIAPLGGGMTNVNVLVSDGSRRAVVRIGDDIPVHQVMRFNELAASRAAHAAGISPQVLYHEPGVLVIDFVEGRTLTAEDLRQPDQLAEALALLSRAHREMPHHLRGPALAFWVFHVVRDYAATLRDGQSPHLAALPALMEAAAVLEAAVGPITLTFCHNDLLPGNFLHDGARMWLIDWDYAGFGSAHFDLGGLAANAGLDPAQERWMLERYFAAPVTADLWRRHLAMKAAAALREMLWSMVSELHSGLDFDFAAYTATTTANWQAALAAFREV
ncbi:MAG: phosphotransferase family protein [Rhodobacteraceae bacterium]|nr:phosphotransferase family protein [Paracoccaceae bacterium]